MKLSVLNICLGCALGLSASTFVYAGDKAGSGAEKPGQAVMMPYRKAAKSLGMTLQDELEKAMQSGGPLAAVEVCNQHAQPISDSVSRAQGDGWIVRRTSAKLRNPENTPLTEQEAAHIQDADFTADSEILETIEKDGKPYHLYMKAIGTQPVCLACHGEAIAPPLAEKLDALYPEDKARGYKAGDVRGAFVIYAPVNP